MAKLLVKIVYLCIVSDNRILQKELSLCSQYLFKIVLQIKQFIVFYFKMQNYWHTSDNKIKIDIFLDTFKNQPIV